MAAKDPEAPESLQTLVVAVDFSETSSRAFERACGIAAARSAELVVVHVLPSAPMAVHGVQPITPPPDLTGHIRELAERELGRLVDRARERGLTAASVLSGGSAGREVVDLAAERGAQLIVLGTRGLTGFSHLVLGSTAEYVVRHAHCPVLTIHPDDRGSLDEARNVIIPIELRGDPEPAAREVLRVLGAAAREARVLLTYSDHLPAYLQPWMGELGIDRIGLEEIRGRVEDELGPAAERLRALGFEVEVVVCEGEPASVVTELAGARDADLVAMETHGRTGAAHLLLGSTAERVVQHAGCAVLTVRRDDDTDEAEGAPSR